MLSNDTFLLESVLSSRQPAEAPMHKYTQIMYIYAWGIYSLRFKLC
jgi:hypothetical protein